MKVREKNMFRVLYEDIISGPEWRNFISSNVNLYGLSRMSQLTYLFIHWIKWLGICTKVPPKKCTHVRIQMLDWICCTLKKLTSYTYWQHWQTLSGQINKLIHFQIVQCVPKIGALRKVNLSCSFSSNFIFHSKIWTKAAAK